MASLDVGPGTGGLWGVRGSAPGNGGGLAEVLRHADQAPALDRDRGGYVGEGVQVRQLRISGHGMSSQIRLLSVRWDGAASTGICFRVTGVARPPVGLNEI